VGTCLRSTHPPPLLRGFTFLEAPETGSPSARLLWHARLDPAVLEVEARPTLSYEPDAFDLRRFEAFAIVAKGISGKEHIALSDGYRRIRIDVVSGTLLEGPVILTHRLTGLIGLSPILLALRRLSALTKTLRFGASLFPVTPQTARIVAALQVFDGLAVGASQRDIAVALYGLDRVMAEWFGASDSMRSRVRRLVALALDLADGGWQRLLL
jgi:hypothetical protein